MAGEALEAIGWGGASGRPPAKRAGGPTVSVRKGPYRALCDIDPAIVGAVEPFVSVEWLVEHRTDAVLADVRWYADGRSGRAGYEAAHIPGAVFVDLDQVLSARHADDSRGRHPLPSPEDFADALSALGIGDEDTVVAYDDVAGVIAARMVWMLRVTGHAAALLDGGLGAWPAEDLGNGPPRERPPARFTPRPWPAERLATIDDAARGAGVLIDARERARYRGGPDALDPRFGHIPGARSVPAREHLDASGLIASPQDLRETFAGVGIRPGTPVISYCGSGVTACHNLLALERAGLGPGRLYPGSWSEWSRDRSRPLETG